MFKKLADSVKSQLDFLQTKCDYLFVTNTNKEIKERKEYLISLIKEKEDEVVKSKSAEELRKELEAIS